MTAPPSSPEPAVLGNAPQPTWPPVASPDPAPAQPAPAWPPTTESPPNATSSVMPAWPPAAPVGNDNTVAAPQPWSQATTAPATAAEQTWPPAAPATSVPDPILGANSDTQQASWPSTVINNSTQPATYPAIPEFGSNPLMVEDNPFGGQPAGFTMSPNQPVEGNPLTLSDQPVTLDPNSLPPSLDQANMGTSFSTEPAPTDLSHLSQSADPSPGIYTPPVATTDN
jgi:hypothetical protein